MSSEGMRPACLYVEYVHQPEGGAGEEEEEEKANAPAQKALHQANAPSRTSHSKTARMQPHSFDPRNPPGLLHPKG